MAIAFGAPRLRSVVFVFGLLGLLAIGAACSSQAATPTPPAAAKAITAPAKAPAKVVTPAAPIAATPEVVHATYVDLASNVTDLRTRVTAWARGDEQSLGIAQEKADRIAVLLAHPAWPEALAGPTGKLKAALVPLAAALKAKNAVGAKQQLEPIGAAADDLSHAVYEKWLPTHKGVQLGPMAGHVGYLDLAANLEELRGRIAEGEGADLGEAEEAAERMEALFHGMPWPGALASPVERMEKALPAVTSALRARDAAAARQALTPIDAAAEELKHVYEKSMAGVRSADDPACVQASYMDLTANVAELRTRLAAWEKGDAAGLAEAKESAERLGTLLDHAAWPGSMAEATGKIRAAMPPIDAALRARDVAAAQQALNGIGEAPHDLTQGYYDKWLMGAAMGTSAR